MKRFIIGLAMAAAVCVSSTASANSEIICTTHKGVDFVMDYQGSAVAMKNQVFNFVKTDTLPNGVDVHVFSTERRNMMLAIATPDGGSTLFYQVRRDNNQVLDKGTCTVNR